MAINPTCPCINLPCPRHDNCDACRAHHAPNPTYCEKIKLGLVPKK